MNKESETKKIALRLIRLLKEEDKEVDKRQREKEKFSKMTPVELLRYCVSLSEERLRKERYGNG